MIEDNNNLQDKTIGELSLTDEQPEQDDVIPLKNSNNAITVSVLVIVFGAAVIVCALFILHYITNERKVIKNNKTSVITQTQVQTSVLLNPMEPSTIVGALNTLNIMYSSSEEIYNQSNSDLSNLNQNFTSSLNSSNTLQNINNL